MKINWKNIEQKDEGTIESWLSSKSDRRNLCMTQKGWNQTASEIQECFKCMDNSEFKNIIGFVNDEPVVALMYGIENIGILNLYNIIVSPKQRQKGVAKKVLLALLENDKSLNNNQFYNMVRASALPDNENVLHLFENLEFNNLGFDGEYVVFEKEITKIEEMVK